LIRNHRTLLQALSALLLSSFSQFAFALSWNSQSPQADARFYSGADKAFIGQSLDLSGIGVMQSGWATMISDHYFLSSYHIGPPQGNTPVDFYRTNSMDTSPGNFVQEHIDPSFGMKIAGTDIWLGRMIEAAPTWVNKYPLIKRPTATNYTSYLDPSIYVAGYSGAGQIDYVRSYLGTNTINTFSNTYSDVFGSIGIGLTYTKDANAGGSEAVLVPGDSSGPTFVPLSGGGLALTGLHWQINQDGSTDSNVSAYVSQIVSEVPEKINVVTDLAGDLNGDYRVNFQDILLFSKNYLKPGMKYNDGDVNGDGVVNGADFFAIQRNFGKTSFAPSDFNQDQSVDRNDFLQIANHWHSFVTPKTEGDANGDGYVGPADMAVLNANWLFGTWKTSHPTTVALGDINGDGLVDFNDEQIVQAHWNSSCLGQTCGGADINLDGVVNQADLDYITRNWNEFGPADINHDLKVDNYDLSIVLAHWGQTTTAGQAAGDLNGDGVVNSADFALMADWWGRGVGDASQQPTLTAVPEPAALMLAAIGFAWTASKRRRR
jgi:hypothetical protein